MKTKILRIINGRFELQSFYLSDFLEEKFYCLTLFLKGHENFSVYSYNYSKTALLKELEIKLNELEKL